MILAGTHQDEDASQWIKSVKDRDEQCAALVQSICQQGMPVVKFRGSKQALLLRREAAGYVALFSGFATVRASDLMCPRGSAAYYELHILY